jgi:hypothetical protein
MTQIYGVLNAEFIGNSVDVRDLGSNLSYFLCGCMNGLKKPMKNVSQYRRPSGQNLNPGPPE